jgi:hypothetical protein
MLESVRTLCIVALQGVVVGSILTPMIFPRPHGRRKASVCSSNSGAVIVIIFCLYFVVWLVRINQSIHPSIVSFRRH